MQNRFVVLAGALAVQLAIGAVYAWSVFSQALQSPDALGLSPAAAAVPFETAIGTIVLGTFVGGWLQDRRGPRAVALTGVGLYSAGMILSSLATTSGDLWILVLSYGVLGGFGLGMAYIVPLAMLQKWFPTQRALITGLAAGGFGFGAIITSPVAQALCAANPTHPTIAFLYLGIGYLVVGMLGAATFGLPRNASGAPQHTTQEPFFTVGQALQTRQWFWLTFILTMSVTAGISLISMAASAATDIAGLSVTAAASAVGVLALFNGGGRIVWAWLSDRMGQMRALACVVGLQGLALVALPHASSPVAFLTLAAVIYTCYGGAFGVLPATAGRFFGLRHAGAIYGLMLVGWSAGGIMGPVVAAWLVGTEQNYVAGFTVVGVVAIVAVFATRITPPTPQDGMNGEPVSHGTR